MKKLAMLILVFGLAVSVNAATIQVADYLADPTWDNTVIADWDVPGGWIFAPHDLEYIASQPSTGWSATGFPWYDGRFIANMGTDAYNGTQALALATNSSYSYMGVGTFPNVNLNSGDTLELDFAVKALADTTYPPGDVYVRVNVDGLDYATMIIPAASITGDWVEYHYSETYTGPTNPWAGGWRFEILMDVAPGWGGVYIDIVPEPATMSLLGFGALALIRRTK